MQTLTYTNDLGSIELSQSQPYLLQLVEGISGLGVVTEVQAAPFQDGNTYKSNNFVPRDISINGVIIVDDSSLETKKRELATIFNPKIEGTLKYSNGTIEKECTVRLNAGVRFGSNNESKGYNYQRFQIQMTAHNPFWLDLEFSSQILALSIPAFEFPLIAEPTFEFETDGTNRATITNDGDVATPVEITFTGPANNPKIINETTGEFIKVTKNLGTDEYLKITTGFGNNRVFFNDGSGEVNALGLIDLDSTFWKLQTGDNVVSYSVDSGVSTATMLIRWKERFISL